MSDKRYSTDELISTILGYIRPENPGDWDKLNSIRAKLRAADALKDAAKKIKERILDREPMSLEEMTGLIKAIAAYDEA
jgi:hypothetical protein